MDQIFFVPPYIIADFLMVYNILKIRPKDQLPIIIFMTMGLNMFRKAIINSFDDKINAKFMGLNVFNES